MTSWLEDDLLYLALEAQMLGKIEEFRNPYLGWLERQEPLSSSTTTPSEENKYFGLK